MGSSTEPGKEEVSVHGCDRNQIYIQNRGGRQGDVGEASWGRWQLNWVLKEGEIRFGGDKWCLGIPKGVVAVVCNLGERLQRLCVSICKERGWRCVCMDVL